MAASAAIRSGQGSSIFLKRHCRASLLRPQETRPSGFPRRSRASFLKSDLAVANTPLLSLK
ncbi:hypothetical protein GFGA_1c0678 [Gluconobacter frateurii NBRC 103465]|nr:hypothetical protein GFGA_1c0678 [Gluconobacter frateurii NBRC 103465]